MSFTTDVRQFENADLQRFPFTAIAPGTHKRRALMLRVVLLKLGQETTGSKKNCGFSDGPRIWGENSACSGVLPGRIESREIACFLCYAVVCGSVANWRRWLREVPVLLCVNKKRDSVRPSPLSSDQEHLPWRLSLQRVGDGVELCVCCGTDGSNCSDADDDDQSQHDSIFNRCWAIFRNQKLLYACCELRHCSYLPDVPS